jgi:hypothetical protein
VKALGPVIAVVIVVALLVSGTLYTVDQRQHAIVFQLGEIKGVVEKPGLHFKIPLLQNVRLFDMRILTYDDAEPLRFLTQGNRPVLVDSFVKWHIIDAKQYYVSVQGDENLARVRLTQAVNGSLREEFGKRTIHEVVSGEREKIMDLMREKADQTSREIGVQVLDVRLKRVDFTPEISESVYGRMQADRKRVANELRARVPVVFMAFDLMCEGGELILERPLRERRNRLEGVVIDASRGAQLSGLPRGGAVGARRLPSARRRPGYVRPPRRSTRPAHRDGEGQTSRRGLCALRFRRRDGRRSLGACRQRARRSASQGREPFRV